MADKFGRIFEIIVDTKDEGSFTITSPYTVEFNVVRKTLASANEATITIYNLNQTSRSLIFKDPYTVRDEDRRGIVFRAGYQAPESFGSKEPTTGAKTKLPIVFAGEVRQCYSVREGVDMKTELSCYDGGAALSNSFTSNTIQSGEDLKNLIKSTIEDLKGVEKLTIGNIVSTTSKRATALWGNTADLIKECTNNQFYIDCQKAYVLADNEVLMGEVTEIGPENGLLETPKRHEKMLDVTMMFEPRIRPSQLISLKTVTAKNFVGLYKVIGVHHQGVISGAVSGTCTTTVTLIDSHPYVLVEG